MAFSLIANTQEVGGQNGGTTGAIDTTGADLLLISIFGYPSSVSTVSDSKSNSWNILTLRASASIFTGLFWSTPVSVGSGHTFSVSGANTFGGLQVQAWSGSAASPFDQESGTTSGGVSTLQPGSLTPSEDNCLVITGMAHEANTSGATSINGGFTISDGTGYQGGVHEGGSMAYLVQTSAAAANPTWNITNATAAIGAAMAVFKAASGGGGGSVVPMIMHSYRRRRVS